MSAAEKLKALGKRFPPDPSEEWTAYELDDHVTALAALRNVLPQIVAVVEAAEAHIRSDVWIEGQPLHGPSIYAELNNGTTASEALRDALAALDEAL